MSSPPLSTTDIYTLYAQGKLCEQVFQVSDSLALDAKYFDTSLALRFLCYLHTYQEDRSKGMYTPPNEGPNVRMFGRIFETATYALSKTAVMIRSRLPRCALMWCGVVELVMSDSHR